MFDESKGPGDATSLGAFNNTLLGSTSDGERKMPCEVVQGARRVSSAPEPFKGNRDISNRCDVDNYRGTLLSAFDEAWPVAEQELLGWLIRCPHLDAACATAGTLEDDDFCEGLHRQVFRAVSAALQAGRTASVAELNLALAESTAFRDLDRPDYLRGLAQAAPALSSGLALAAQVREFQVRNRGAREFAALADDMLRSSVRLGDSELRIQHFQRHASDRLRNYAGSHRIQLIGFEDIKLGTARRDLVKGLIPRSGVTLLWGPPKCGKSFLVYDLSMRVALGWDYRGRRVQPGAVIYCAFEGQSGFEKRAAAFRKEFLAEHDKPIPFYLMPLRLDLVGDHAELIGAIKRTLPDGAPVLVVLDTLNRSINGSESDDRDMTAYFNAADAIREAFDCAVIIVHHCGLDASRPRGHTSLAGGISAQIAVKRDASDNIVAELELMREGPQGDQIVSRLQLVEVGMDDDGDALMSCVLIPSEPVAKAAKSASLTPGESGWHNDLLAMFAEPGATQMTVPTSGMPQVPTLTREQVRAGFKRKGRFTLEPDGTLTGADREKMSKALCALKDKRKICMTDKYVWLLGERQ